MPTTSFDSFHKVLFLPTSSSFRFSEKRIYIVRSDTEKVRNPIDGVKIISFVTDENRLSQKEEKKFSFMFFNVLLYTVIKVNFEQCLLLPVEEHMHRISFSLLAVWVPSLYIYFFFYFFFFRRDPKTENKNCAL